MRTRPGLARHLKAKKGPFVLNMPQDVQHSIRSEKNWTYRPMYKAKTLQPPGSEDLVEAGKIVAATKRPTILCGLGAAQGKAGPEVQQLAEYLGAPIATTLYAAGFCCQSPLHIGISGGLGSDLTVDTLAESDVMIVVGASLNECTTHFGKILENGKKIIQIDDREDAFGWFERITVGLEGDSKVAVAALLDRLKEGGKPGRQPDAQTLQKIRQHTAGNKLRRRQMGRSAACRRLSGRQAAETRSHSRVRRRSRPYGGRSGNNQFQRRQLVARSGLRRGRARRGHCAGCTFCATWEARHSRHPRMPRSSSTWPTSTLRSATTCRSPFSYSTITPSGRSGTI
jgi:Thiamine pyrophosphate enzyme, central domain